LFFPLLNEAAIPFQPKKAISIQEVKKDVAKKKTFSTEKSIKKISFFKRQVLKKISRKFSKRGGNVEETPIFNILSIVLSFLGLTALVIAPFVASMGLVYLSLIFGLSAVILGVVGLARREILSGLSVSGIVLGFLGFLIALVVVLIDNEW
jgi:uncharacterized membrane protein